MRNPDRAPQTAGLGDIKAKLMLVVLCTIWGLTWPLMKIALDEIPPLSMRTMTAGLGALTLYVVCLFGGRSFRVPNAKAWAHVVVSAVLNLVCFSLFSAFAQLDAATERVTILAYTMPIWAVLLAWLFLGERPSVSQMLALGLCAAGLAILIYPLTATGIPRGILWALSLGVSWASGTVYVKWAQIKADPLGIVVWQLAISFLIIATSMLIFEGGLQVGNAHFDGLAAIVFAGIGGTGIAYGMWFTVIRRLPAMTASLGVTSAPVIGILSSVLILGEVPTGTDMIGFVLIFASSVCVLLAPGNLKTG